MVQSDQDEADFKGTNSHSPFPPQKKNKETGVQFFLKLPRCIVRRLDTYQSIIIIMSKFGVVSCSTMPAWPIRSVCSKINCTLAKKKV